MANLKKKLINICESTWNFRESPGIWLDSESETMTKENLVYKRLDGLRTILIPLQEKKIDLTELNIKKSDFVEEINTLAEFLISKDHFFPAPYSYIPMYQPDDYIDMVCHSLIFAIHAYNLNVQNIKKTILQKLIERCVSILIADGNYYHEIKKGYAAWAGTTIYESESFGIEVKSTYFTSQVVIALNTWMKWIKTVDKKSNLEKIKNVEKIVTDACRWILLQNDGKKILMGDGNENKNPQINEIITINSTSLRACIESSDILSPGEKSKTQELTEKFIELLNTRKIELIDADWYHRVITNKSGPQYYVDRQENFGILVFLAYASALLKEKWKNQIEESAEHFISFYIEDIVVKDQYIGCLPWYIEDVIKADENFSITTEKIEVPKRRVKEAVALALKDNTIIDALGSSVLKYLIELISKEKLKVFEGSKPKKTISKKKIRTNKK